LKIASVLFSVKAIEVREKSTGPLKKFYILFADFLIGSANIFLKVENSYENFRR